MLDIELRANHAKLVGKLCHFYDMISDVGCDDILVRYDSEYAAKPWQTRSNRYRWCRPLTMLEVEKLIFEE